MSRNPSNEALRGPQPELSKRLAPPSPPACGFRRDPSVSESALLGTAAFTGSLAAPVLVAQHMTVRRAHGLAPKMHHDYEHHGLAGMAITEDTRPEPLPVGVAKSLAEDVDRGTTAGDRMSARRNRRQE